MRCADTGCKALALANIVKPLHKLSQQALQAFKIYCQDQGQQVVVSTLKIRPAIESFEYRNGCVSYHWRKSYVARQEWPLADQFRFIQRVLKPLSSYQHCLGILANFLHSRYEQAEPRLIRYLQVLLERYFDAKEQPNIEELCEIFVHDLTGDYVRWTVRGAIRGIALETEQCVFGKYHLRRPVAQDFAIEQSLDDAASETVRHPFITHPPSAFLEFETQAIDHTTLRKEYEYVEDLLRLFRLGSVTSVALMSMPESVIHTGGAFYPVLQKQATYVYHLKASDQRPLETFIECNRTHLKRVAAAKSQEECAQAICLAHQNFKRAVLNHSSIPLQIMCAVTALQSLFLTATDRERVGARLGQRIGTLMACYGRGFEEVCREVEEGWIIRNASRHQFEQGAIEEPGLPFLAQNLIDYARLSLLIFIQFSESWHCKSLIEQLDRAQRSTRAWKRLLNFVTNKATIPV